MGIICPKGSVTNRFCPRQTSYGRSSGDPHPPPLRNITHFFRFYRGPRGIIYLAPLRLSVVPGPDNEHKNIYLKYKYTHENAGFLYIICIDDFKILKILNKSSKFSTIFHRETSQAPTPPPLNVHMTFLVDKIDM